MKKFATSLLLILALAVIFTVGFLVIEKKNSKLEDIQAAAGGNVIGWAWFGSDCTNESTCSGTIDPVGWISFSDANPEITCSGATYGVSVDYDTGELSGAGFVGVGEDSNNGDCNTIENSLGWLNLDSSATPACGSAGYPADYCFPAKMVGNEIQGWAPITSKDAGGSEVTAAWVRFKGANYSVKINADGTVGTAGQPDHYAWSSFAIDDGFGWIDLSRAKFPSFNQSPYIQAASQVIEYQIYCNVFPGQGQVGFKWTYRDPDTDAESRFDFRINNINDVNDPSPEVDRSYAGLNNPDGTVNAQTVLIKSPLEADKITYNTTYYWWVRVWDSKGADSGWSAGTSFNTESHAWPFPDFTHLPLNPSVQEKVNFIDDSTCYDNNNNPFPCKNDAGAVYLWDFGDTQTSSKRGDTSHKYSAPGQYNVKLTVAVESGAKTCAGQGDSPVGVQFTLPEWIEIPPF